MQPQIIHLRKFPFPYRAALAVCSDVDNTPSPDIYKAQMDYFNGTGETVFGKGLGLEMGNSFWFFNKTETPQVSYFEGDGTRETPFAPYCRELLKSGHIDVLHTYGNFDGGGFTRTHAETSFSELDKLNVCVHVWVNHGSRTNGQNIGPFDGFNGAVPGTAEYHNDMMQEHGVRFISLGRMTHVIGQNARKTPAIIGKNTLQGLVFTVKHRRVKEIFYDSKNRLMRRKELPDGTTVWEFTRWVNAWGRQHTLDINDLVYQLKPSVMRRLVKNEGFLVVYTHICEGLHSGRHFPEALKENLRYIGELHKSGTLLMTTTSRMLRYAEMTELISYETESINNTTKINISPSLKSPAGELLLSETGLQGLTFYCTEPEKVEMQLGGKRLALRRNPPDFTGRRSVSIPWQPLEYPFD
ncbi:hypothetical protein ACFL6L_00825 [candidate division KSB1 bacterium]